MTSKSMQSLSHDVKLSCNMGELVPIACFEAVPSDKIDQSTACLLRTQPLVSPVMHEVKVDIQTWFVPNRLIWDDWDSFWTGGADGMDASVAPTIESPSITGFAEGTLGDYLGVPTGVPNKIVSALPFRAYQLIWNTWYRDEDLQSEASIGTASGVDITTSRSLQFGCWEKDYFTSARPAPQKGPAVTIPLVGTAPVEAASAALTKSSVEVAGVNKQLRTQNANTDVYVSNVTDNTNPLFVDGTAFSSFNIDDLRLGAALQRFAENISRFGNRPIERLMQAFGVRPEDYRLQLPEYLGGGQQRIQFSEVLATAESTGVEIGDMKGHGIAALRSNRYRYHAKEYGIIITLMCVRPRTQYIQGLNKMWMRSTKEDYLMPELVDLGQQEVLNQEVYLAHTTPLGVFGYQDRYDEYRTIPSRIAGEFRSSLDIWHMARKFTSDPALNSSFVQSNPTTRIYSVTSGDQLYISAKHKIKAVRPMPKRSRPRLM
ncbi:MAG: major capsid protein [Microviridae sp.]|nr:MAG: major capsid protein [Microviridae sp.]